MSNETDLDWLARNVHVWPAGDHQPWCYVYWKGGKRAVSGNCITAIQPCVRVEMSEWLARRAELQNKPSWDEVPSEAQYMTQNSNGAWGCWIDKPAPVKEKDGDGDTVEYWGGNKPLSSFNMANKRIGDVLGDWRDTLEKRPEEFKPFTSIEDNQDQVLTQQQDNGWFERGELPPVGVVCEAYIDYPPQWIEAEIVAHKDGFAIGWCKSVMKGCHGDKASEFRPIRTEREVAIEEMCNVAGLDGLVFGLVAGKLYDAGYRKESK